MASPSLRIEEARLADQLSLPSEPSSPAMQPAKSKRMRSKEERRAQREAFEHAADRLDVGNERRFKRAREAEAHTADLVRFPAGDSYPWNKAEQTLFAALNAVARTCQISHPDLTVASDPQAVYEWVWKNVLAFAREMQEEAKEDQRHRVGIPLNPRHARITLEAIATLQEMLTLR